MKNVWALVTTQNGHTTNTHQNRDTSETHRNKDTTGTHRNGDIMETNRDEDTTATHRDEDIEQVLCIEPFFLNMGMSCLVYLTLYLTFCISTHHFRHFMLMIVASNM